MYYVIYQDPSSELWRWTLHGENDRKIAESVERHYNKGDCQAAIEMVKKSGSAPIRER